MKKSYVRSLFVCFCIIVATSGVFANSFANQKNASVIVTKYFDIIYTQESAYAAQILAEEVDNLYLKACTLLEADPYFRMPLVLSPDTDLLNGGFTYSPYNMIMLYDTLPGEGSLAVFSESLLSLFYHEVVHAVSIQKKSNFWRFAGNIFGDILTPAPLLNLPLSFLEGVTVSFESKDGEGRLNDIYSTHVLGQAKLEGKFPDWKQIAYTRDIYPVGSLPYIFGGAFSAYIQQRFGMEKYAEYWEECGKIQWFKFVPGVFKKVYKKDIEKVWDDFEASIILPTQVGVTELKQGIESPITTDMLNIEDYEDASVVKNRDESVFSSITISPRGIAWIDDSSSAVYFLPEQYVPSGEIENAEKLFDCSYGQSGLSFSSDGRYLVSSYVYPYPMGKNTVQIYDMDKGSFTSEKIVGIRDAILVTLEDGKEYIAGVETKSQFASIVLYDRSTLQETIRRDFPLNAIPFSLTDAQEGVLVYTLKDKNEWYIVLYNPLTNEEVRLNDPENPIVIRNINPVIDSESDSVELSFSYTNSYVDGTFPRMGRLSVDYGSSLQDAKVSVQVQEKDISGGVYAPVQMGSTVIFTARYYDHDKLYRVPSSVFCTSPIFTVSPSSPSFEEQRPENKVTKFEETSYIPLKYMLNGIFIPSAMVTMTSGLKYSEVTLDDFGLSLGFNYITQDPTGVWAPSVALKFDVIKLNGTASLSVTNMATPVIITGACTTNFDIIGNQNTTASLNASYTLPLGNTSNSFSFANYIGGYWQTSSITGSFNHSYSDSAQIVFSTIKSKGLGYFENAGFEALIGGGLSFFPSEVSPTDLLRYDYKAGLAYFFSRLLPIDNTRTLTFNLPTIIQAQVFPDMSSLWTATADVILFGVEIQEGIPYLPVYINRLRINADYTGGHSVSSINYKDPLSNFTSPLEYQDSVGLTLNVTSRFIVGTLLTQVPIDLRIQTRYYFRTQQFKFSLMFFNVPLF